MSTKAPVLEVCGLTKQFGRGGKTLEALKGVTFDVPRGSVFTILGPNGAGKTTLIRILTTLMHPKAGTAFLDGQDILKHPLSVRQKIGVVFQENHFDKYLSIWDNLKLHAKLHGMASEDYLPRIESLMKKVSLWERREAMADQLSGGQQRRIALIRALIHSPNVLFLDEPSTGLDPQARREIWDMILAFKQTETVILTTHYMEEADQLSDHLLMMDHGSVVLTGTANQLKRHITPRNQMEVLLTPSAVAEDCLRRLTHPAVQALKQAAPDVLTFELTDPDALWAVMANLPPEWVARVGQVEMDLESVFLEVAEGRLGQKELDAKTFPPPGSQPEEGPLT